MLYHEPPYQQLVNGAKRSLLIGQPLCEMLDAVEVRANSRSAVSVALQIADVSVGAPAQNTRSEPVSA
jgi:hypothetical protein